LFFRHILCLAINNHRNKLHDWILTRGGGYLGFIQTVVGNMTIKKVKEGYRLVSKKGKNLGTYKDKAGAAKRERQVQYFKHAKG